MRTYRVAILTCGCLTLAIVPGNGLRARTPQSARSQTASVVSTETKREIKTEFSVVNMGEMDTKYGVRLGFTNLKASDGVGVRVFYLAKDDEVQAKQAFDQALARAIKVIQRDEKKDEQGKVVGERAQILVPSVKPSPPFHAIIWTDGPRFHEIGSNSLQYVLELEKIYR
jgi:hypothetical protein